MANSSSSLNHHAASQQRRVSSLETFPNASFDNLGIDTVPFREFEEAILTPGFSQRDPDALQHAREKLNLLTQADVDWMLLETAREGLQGRGTPLSRLSIQRDLLIRRASVSGMADALNYVVGRLNEGVQSNVESFGTRTLREIFKMLPSAWDSKVEGISSAAAEKLIQDIFEKVKHADLEQKAVAPHGRTVRMAIQALRLAEGPQSATLAKIAAQAFTELTDETRHKVPRKTSRGSFFSRDYDFDDDFGIKPKRAGTSPQKKLPGEMESVSLIAKLADDDHNILMARRSRPMYREPEDQERYDAWQKWAKRRQAQAAIYMQILGEAGIAASYELRHEYAKLLEAHLCFKNKALAGSAVSALGALVRSFTSEEQAVWLGKVEQQISGFKAKGNWQILREDMDLALRHGDSSAFDPSSLTRFLTDSHPKVRKAAFRRLETMLDEAPPAKRRQIIGACGLLQRHPFGMETKARYPITAAGRMTQLLYREMNRASSPEVAAEIGAAWAGIQIAFTGQRKRAQANLPALDASIDLIVPRARTWPGSNISALAYNLLDHLPSQRSFFSDLDPQSKFTVCHGVLRLTPFLSSSQVNEIAELLVIEKIPLESLLVKISPEEREAIEARISEPYVRLNEFTAAFSLRDYEKRLPLREIRSLWFAKSDTEKEDPVKKALIDACDSRELRFLIEEAVKPLSPEASSTDERNRLKAEIKRRKNFSASEQLIKENKTLSPAELGDLIPFLQEVCCQEDGSRGRYGTSISERREYALRLLLAVSTRLFTSEGFHSEAFQSVCTIAGAKDESLSARALEYLSTFTQSIGEAYWNELGEKVRECGAAQRRFGYYLTYAAEIVGAAKDPAVRAFHLDMLLDEVRADEGTRQDTPRLIADVVAGLAPQEGRKFIDTMHALISSRQSSGERRRIDEQLLAIEVRDSN